ncbi:MAG TPA: GLUG motif-containing protein [Rhizomicrobium sp.]|jgi:hypothetical protein
MDENSRCKRLSWSTLLCAGSLLGASQGVHAALVISADATQNVNCAGTVCKATDHEAVLNVGDLADMLAVGNVTVFSGHKAKNIQIAAPLSWTHASGLTLDAYGSLAILQPLVVAGTGGSLTIKTNSGGAGGDFSVANPGHVEFWDLKSSFAINGNAYQLVNTIQQLAAAIAANPAGFYALAKSYDALSDGTFAGSPVGTTLVGTFEDLGNAISNLHIRAPLRSGNVGLFAEMEKGAIRNLAISGATVTARGKRSVAGMLVGVNNGSIAGVRVSGTVKAFDGEAGGLCGVTSGSIANSSAEGAVSGGQYAGGLCAYVQGGSIHNSSAAVDVSGTTMAGGLIGGSFQFNSGEGIFDSSATGPVAGTNFVGGLIGYCASHLERSFSTGAVVGGTGGEDADVGGLIGLADSAYIRDSYARGSASGGSGAKIGGLVGSAGNGSIWLSYSTGKVSGAPGSSVGGFSGRAVPGNEVDDYWDVDTSGTIQASGDWGGLPNVTGLTTKQFKSNLPDGFDGRDWAQKKAKNDGYPYLRLNPPPQ